MDLQMRPLQALQLIESGRLHDESSSSAAEPKIQMVGSCARHGSLDRFHQAIRPAARACKSIKSDYDKTPGRRAQSLDAYISVPSCLSPFSARSAQWHRFGDLRPTEITSEDYEGSEAGFSRPSTSRVFQGCRQPSLQEWCAEAAAGASPSAAPGADPSPQLTQTFRLVPHGSPKLTKANVPIFAPPAPKKGKRHRKDQRRRSLSAIAQRDALADLLCCNEDLSWNRGSEGIGSGPLSTVSQGCLAVNRSATLNCDRSSFDSYSMELMRYVELS